MLALGDMITLGGPACGWGDRPNSVWPSGLGEEAMSQDLLAYYRSKGLGRVVGFGIRPALLIVDMSKAFTDPSSPLGCPLDAVVAQIARLLHAFRVRRLPVIYTTVAYEEPDSRDGGWFVTKVPSLRMLTAGSAWVQIDPRLTPRPGEPVLVKKYASAFFGTDLQTRLVTRGVDTLVITGATTSGCVRATAVDGMQYGYRVLVVEDAVGDRSQEAHRANLVDIEAKYGDVRSTEEVLQELERGARQ